MRELARRTRFSKLCRYASVTALAAGYCVPFACAQTGFQGTPTVQGSANPDFSIPGTVVVRDADTVINWRPTDISAPGTIDFLPANQTMTFRNEVSGVNDFTVLNRILPVNGSGQSVSSIIALNGTVNSEINGSPGGKVWFYAPGGIVAGPGAVFNVGSLVLTSNDIDYSNGLGGGSGTIRFGTALAGSAVQIQSGAQINALSSGSYVALVAPRVVQGGTVRVNGSAAYVGAGAADITINGGLFDISISAGTSDANGVVHTGTTERPGATVTEAQHVFMVAMPKNSALTMLLSGNVGYDAAASAVQSDSAVVLSAGYDVTNGAIGARNVTGTGEASISIGGGTWQPDVTGHATGNISVQPGAAANFANVNLTAERAITLQSGAAGAIAATGTMDLKAGEAITVRADQGGSIGVGGDMNLTAGIGGTGGTIDVLTFGGSALPAGNGQIDVTGTLRLSASAAGLGSFNFPVLAGGDATGGAINVVAAGGSISAGSLFADADATAGVGSDSAGNATGGSITVSARTAAGPSGALAGTIDFGNMILHADAGVEYSYYSPPVTGGNATGGTISVSAAGGSVTTGHFDLYASGAGGDASGVAGTGTGGSITLSANAANGLRGDFAADCTSYCNVTTDGRGAYGANGANGTGGSILIHATDASFVADGGLTLHAKGIGGGTQYSDSIAGRGGDGLGGSISVESRAGSAGSADMRFGALFASADGVSTEASFGLMAALSLGGSDFNQGDGGNGTGGSVNFLVAGGNLDAGSLYANANGQGGSSSVNCPSCGDGVTPFQAGNGQGGSVQFLMTGGAASIVTLELGAGGVGGEAMAANASDEVSSLAGSGSGGTVLLESRGGVLNADAIHIEASGVGGGSDPYSYYNYNGPNGADGGTGIGGTARLLMGAGGTGQIIVTEDLSIRAEGHGGAGGTAGSDGSGGFYIAGAGGGGTGGTAELTLASGALTAPSLLVSAAGVGGAGGNNSSDLAGGAAGSGTGGTARVAYLSEGHAIGALTVSAEGKGGLAGINGYIDSFDEGTGEPIYAYGPGQGGAGGSGQGGTADMLIDVDPGFASLIVSADGFGSAGAVSASSGAGGTGTGGIAALNIGFGATSVSGELRVSASGFGGDGGMALNGAAGRGGDAFGGTATLGLTGASTSLDAGDIGVLAEALGGTGGLGAFQSSLGLAGADGGNAVGGTALFAVNAGASAVTGAELTLSGNATGGAGSAGFGGPAGGAGGSGGDAAGGSAILRIDGGKLRVSNSFSTLPAYSITAVGQGGAGADGGVASDPALGNGAGGNGGSGAGGLASFEANDSDFLMGPLSIVADGAAGLAGAGGIDGLTSGGTARLINGGGAVLGTGVQRQVASLSMTASGDAGGAISFADSSTAAGGGLRVAGPMTLHATGTVVPGLTGISFAASGDVVQVDGAADFLTQGPLSFAFDAGGGLAAAGALTGYSGTSISFSHGARPAGADSVSAGSIALNTPGGVTGTGASLRSAGLLTISGAGINVQALASGGAAALDAGAGDLVVNDLLAQRAITALGRNINLGSSGGMSIANAVASGDLLLNAAGLVAVNGLVSGQAVTIGSGDIAIGANGQVNAAGLLRFDALGAQAFIGGGDATTGYSLSTAELGRVSAADIAINGAGDVVLRDLTIGTAMLPGGGVMSIGAAGLLRVQGAVAMTGRTGVGGLTLTAGEALEVIAGLGSISISDSNGVLGGVLTLEAPSIYAATAEAIADVRAADSLTARELRLAQNDGLALDAGMLQAGTIRLAATEGIFIQNSGLSTSFADRRGFTANNLIISSGNGRPQIAINGRLALADGGFATGLDTIPLVTIDGRYAAGSKINGCFIFGSCTTLSFDNRETFDGLLDPTVAVSRIFPTALIELRDVVTEGYPPLIDEPVTGAGNEDLWDRPCGGPGEPACDAQ